jgi:branched-chain amino acid aminotransferase
MAINASKYIWFNGRFVPWEKATIHVMTHALHYGSSVFEGVRAYTAPRGIAIFRLREHTQRLFDSAKIYRIQIPYSADEINAACRDVVAVNDLTSGAYLRPIAFRGYGEIGVAPKHEPPIDVAVAAIEWGAYLGTEGLENGVDVCISSWQRVAPNTLPAMAKAGGNYLSSQLISLEAKRLGFAEGIGLSPDGLVSEGAGENIFVIKNGVIHTPSFASSVLGGITRDAAMRLARDLGYEVRESSIPREMLYLADEIFFTGTAAEVTPVRSVDRITVGCGKRGPITRAVQERFFGLFTGATPDQYGWLDYVDMSVRASVANG